MQLADSANHSAKRSSAMRTSVVMERNQTTYDRLKRAIELQLRRQIFVAVCDDLSLRNRLVIQLHADLDPSAQTPFNQGILPQTSIEAVLADLLQEPPSEAVYPQVVSLNLDLAHPDPFAQIALWLTQYPPRSPIGQPRQVPSFQILGVEHLTRQPATTQQRFLLALQQVERSLSSLESCLILWVSRPWLNVIQQSAPAFWNCHTALLEFEGDPTPSPAVIAPVEAAAVEVPPVEAVAVEQVATTSVVVPAPIATEVLANNAVTDAQRSLPHPDDERLVDDVARNGVIDNSSQPPLLPLIDDDVDLLGVPGQAEDLWDILTYDLAMLDEYAAEPPSEAPVEAVEPAIAPGLTAPSPPPTQAEVEPAPAVEPPPAEVEPPILQVEESVVETPTPNITVAPATAAEPPTAEPIQLLTLISQVYAEDTLFALVRSEPSDASQITAILGAIARIEQLKLANIGGSTLAAAYQVLGNLYRDRIEQGEIIDRTLIIAIYAYEQTLQHLEDETLPLWADVLNDMGNLYWMLSRQFSDATISLTYLEQGINAYQLALQKTNPTARPHTYAMIQNNLGSAYGDLARYRNTLEVLQKSVQAYEAALQYRRPEEDPARYAATQNNLGTAYWNLAQHQQPVRRLRQAVTAYHEALRYYSPEREPIHYAMLQNNLGTAYWNLAQHAKNVPQSAGISAAELLKEAIKAYSAALAYRTLEVAPNANAATQNNLGTAYWHLALVPETIANDRQTCLLNAIEAYKSALAAVQYLQAAGTNHAPMLTFDPNATQNNLGLAHYQLAIDQQLTLTSDQQANHLDLALQHQVQALQGWENNPDYYQTVLNYIVQTIRACHESFGVQGQNRALSRVPANLMPELLKRL
uniref:Tetratricopeptide repeat protein n=1 Tax=Oscillatoriales cyanobacterium SpSt-418 TaxID=2282169 RepID=A0A7C3PTF4_9CYAN